jgi:tripartite-type tricarboxylate transporter receptor subunit TctC
MNKWKRLLSVLALPCLLFPAAAVVAAYPDKPIKIVVPYSTGGSSDVIARSIGDALGAELGQPVVIENRTGAGSMIGAAYVATAAPDGYTLLLADVPFTIVPALYGPRIKYDAKQDFAPISLLGESPMYLFRHPGFSAATVEDIVKKAKQAPGTVTIGSGGNGSFTHLMAELMMLKTGTQFVHVPYKGAAASVTDLAGGQIDLSFSTMPSAAALYQSKKVLPVAVSSPQRQSETPDVPTLQEAGLPDLTIQSWWGLLAPAQTPAPVLQQLEAAISKVLDSPTVQERLSRVGVKKPARTDAAALQEFLAADFVRWEDVVRDANIKFD